MPNLNQLTSLQPSQMNSAQAAMAPPQGPAQNSLMPQGPAQPPQNPQSPPIALPPPPLSKNQLQKAIKARQVAISNMTKTLNNPVLMGDPDKLQKSLLAGASDIYRITKDQGNAADLIAHAMDIMKDPRGPKAALQDRLTMAISSLSDIDMYARKTHGSRLIDKSQQAPATPNMPAGQ